MWGRGNCVLGFLVFFSGRSWVILQKTFPQDFSKWNVDGKITPACCWNPFDKPMHYRLFDFWFASCCFARSADASGMTPRCWCTCYSAEEDRPRVGDCAILVCTATRLQVRMMSRAVNELILLGVRCYCDNTVILCYCATVILQWCYCDTTVILLWC